MHLLLMTCAPQGTLGDPSLCKKAIDAILKKHPDAQITLCVSEIEYKYLEKIQKMFKGLPTNVDVRYTNHPNTLNIHNTEARNKCKAFYDNERDHQFDAVILLPFHIYRALKRLKKECEDNQENLICVSNYNMDFNLESVTLRRNLPNDINYLKLGIGNDNHGIFLPPPRKNKFEEDYSKKNISDTLSDKDTPILNFLMPGKLEPQGYFANHDLYFGYNNLISDVSSFKPKDFVNLCLQNSNKDHIDIMLNAAAAENHDAHDSGKIDEIIQTIDSNKYRIEFWTKSDSGALEKRLETEPEDMLGLSAKKTCRIINPYPLEPNSFLTFLSIAKPLTLQTGNSSIFEAISLGKIPIYQVTGWSSEFNSALIEYIKDQLGEKSLYYEFMKMINTPYADRGIISDFFNDNQKAIQAEAKRLGEIIQNDKKLNLENNFLNALETNYNLNFSSTTSKANEPLTDTDYQNIIAEIKKGTGANGGRFIVRKLLHEGHYEFVSQLIEHGLLTSCPEACQHAMQQLFQIVNYDKSELSEELLAHEATQMDALLAFKFLIGKGLYPEAIFDPTQFYMKNSFTLEHCSMLVGIGEHLDAAAKFFTVNNFNNILANRDMFNTKKEAIFSTILKSTMESCAKNINAEELLQFYTVLQNLSNEVNNQIDRLTMDEQGLKEFYLQNLRYDRVYSSYVGAITTLPDLETRINQLNYMNNPKSFTFFAQKQLIESLKQLELYIQANQMVAAIRQNDTMEVNRILSALDKVNQSKIVKIAEQQDPLIIEKAYTLALANNDQQLFTKFVGAKEIITQDIMLKHAENILNISEERAVPLGHRMPSPHLSNEAYTKLYFTGQEHSHWEGQILTQKGYNYVKKLQLEARLRGHELKNVYLDPKEHSALNQPVFIGNNGTAIAFVDSLFEKGHFGQVFLGMNIDTGESCAVKALPSGKGVDIEKAILKKMGRLIEQVEHAQESNTSVQYIAQEIAWGTPLHKIIEGKNQQHEALSPEIKQKIMQGCCKEVLEFHHKGFLHRDLSLANIVYDNDKGKSTLIDFGLAAYGGKHLLYRGEQEIGTPLYAPPEIVATMHLPHHFYNHKTDIYSLGILFALLNAKRSPDEIKNNIVRDLEKLYQEKYPGKTLPDESILYNKEFVSHVPGLIRKHIPEVFDYPDLPNNKLIIQMTDPEPQKRPSMQKINQHLNSIYRKAPMAKLYGQSQSNDNIRVDKQEHKTGCLTIHSSRKKRAPPRMT